MKKSIRTKTGVAISCTVFLLLSAICCWVIFFCWEKTEKQLVAEAHEVFDMAIRQDKTQRGEGYLNIFTSKRKTTRTPSKSIMITTEEEVKDVKKKEEKGLSYEERRYINDHVYLLEKNPIHVVRLDSLFKEALKKEGLPGETAVIYTANEKSEYSTSDSMFYKKAIALELVSISSFIKLQGYVKYGDFFVLSKVPHVWTIVVIWLVVALCFLGYNFLKWKEWKLFKIIFAEIPPGASVPETKEEFTFIPSASDKCLKEGLYFNAEIGDIIYENKRIYLSKKSAELLNYLLLGERWFQSYENIKKDIWRSEETSADSVRLAVSRLNKELKAVPELSVRKLTKKGFEVYLDNGSP